MTRTCQTEHYVGEIEHGVPILRGMTKPKLKFRDNVMRMQPGDSFLTTIAGALKIARATRPEAKFSTTREDGKLRLRMDA